MKTVIGIACCLIGLVGCGNPAISYEGDVAVLHLPCNQKLATADYSYTGFAYVYRDMRAGEVPEASTLRAGTLTYRIEESRCLVPAAAVTTSTGSCH